jgi:hypothetical protein
VALVESVLLARQQDCECEAVYSEASGTYLRQNQGASRKTVHPNPNAKRVRTGVIFLNSVKPGSWEKIDLERLDHGVPEEKETPPVQQNDLISYGGIGK